MDADNLKSVFERLKFGEDAFHELMRWRIQRVLLVLPHYDAWILEHDAKLAEQIVGEYHQLNLTTIPRLSTAADGEEALNRLRWDDFDLIIIGMRVGSLSPRMLAEKAREIRPDLAVLMLLSSRSDLAGLDEPDAVDACFLWTGDSRLFLAMIKYAEDRHNAPNDSRDGRVGVLLVVEDSVPFYSAYLPLLYGEMMRQTQRLIGEEMNDRDKYWRMRTRPKVLLARSWEEAIEVIEHYRDALIGIVSDISFHRGGAVDEEAGLSLIERVRDTGISVPVLIQSSDSSMAAEAERRGARFHGKHAGDIHRGMHRFVMEELGFGDFVFRDRSGREVRRVRTLREFEIALGAIPAETLVHHGDRNDYSRWLAAHGEFRVARGIKPVKAADFSNAEEYRAFIIDAFRAPREERHRGRLVDFRFDDPGAPGSIARFGSGSLGGKGRGLAFFNALLSASDTSDRFSPFKVEVPRSLIIATGEFDRFIEEQGLPRGTGDDDDMRRAFLEAPLHAELVEVLRSAAARDKGPLAVRSSSLLEDSQSMPCAGIYDTYMIPSIESPDERLEMLENALRLVWASTFTREAVQYRNALGVGQEEEKMAVLIQSVSGSARDGFWFPRFSGTAQSLNFYPAGPMKREDGVARIAVGLGHAVVGGDRGMMFCPRRPMVRWCGEEDSWREGQTHFWALKNAPSGEGPGNMNRGFDLSGGENSTLEYLSMSRAEGLDVLRHMVSTWDPVAERVVDGMDIPGPRVADFRDILNYEWLPLAPLLDYLMRLSRSAMGIPVELEFAVDWDGEDADSAVFSLLQVRPMSAPPGSEGEPPEIGADRNVILRSEHALGDGVFRGIQDVVWVDPECYDSDDTPALRERVAAINEDLAAEDRYGVFIGPGRWGSRDRFLGIPVTWGEIRRARLIVEIARGPGDPAPSQGSHFFHNLVSLGVGYAYVGGPDSGEFIDWDSLRGCAEGSEGVYRSRLKRPADVVMDGKTGGASLVT